MYHALITPATPNYPTLASGGHNFLDFQAIFIPVNFANQHWALVVVAPQEREILYFDSLARTPARAFQATSAVRAYLVSEATALNLHNFTISEWHIVDAQWQLPQQENGNDCGFFMFQYIRHIALRIPVCHIRAADMGLYRQLLAADLCSLPPGPERRLPS